MKYKKTLLNKMSFSNKIKYLVALGKLLEAYKKSIHLEPCPLCRICTTDNIRICNKCIWAVFADDWCTTYIGKNFLLEKLIILQILK